MTTTCDRECRCSLDGEATHWDDDVLQVAEYSLRQTQRERRMTRSEAAEVLRAEGVAEWGCPERQQHRRGEWEDAVALYLEGVRQ